MNNVFDDANTIWSNSVSEFTQFLFPKLFFLFPPIRPIELPVIKTGQSVKHPFPGVLIVFDGIDNLSHDGLDVNQLFFGGIIARTLLC